MNDLLELKGQFQQRKREGSVGSSNLKKGKFVTIENLLKLKKDLEIVISYWEEDRILDDPLVSVYYNDVIAKSNRIRGFLSKGSTKAESTIVGAKFAKYKYEKTRKHIITHCVKKEVIVESIQRIEKSVIVLETFFNGVMTSEILEKINDKKKTIKYDESIICRSHFTNIIVDTSHIEKFGVELDDEDNFNEDAIITIYNTGVSTIELMQRININMLSVKTLDDTTLLLSPEQYKQLKREAPYLIAMAVSDLSDFVFENDLSEKKSEFIIADPENEPVIGVIDTMFDENVYFSKWVEFVNTLGEGFSLEDKDYEHGTKVTSIIVDGHSINPALDDGCGNFRVRHFGVAKCGKFSSFTILRKIKEIVEGNKDIKVWNLSLGSALEISPNFISPEAAILDQIQFENDVIFVIAGTNKISNTKKSQKIGAPADSINSLVVNSVDFNGNPASYSREGLVLSFFNKPDVCYYGGDGSTGIRTCTSLGEYMSFGTSYAAPWITRKIAYLIHIMGLSRETAKALIIDSSADWNTTDNLSIVKGFGIVPIKIGDIVKSNNDEIRFIISGVSEKYDTYNFNLPVPIHMGKQPFIAKATLCYFPKCSRNQGVDYTNTELDIHFGRLNGKEIKTVNDNRQSDKGIVYHLYEGNARKLYRKWDNVLHICEKVKSRVVPKKVYDNGLWGLSIKTKERLEGKDGIGLRFGIVVTLKEINGVNRIEDFIHQCSFRGWLVNRINVDNRIDLYNIAEEEIVFNE